MKAEEIAEEIFKELYENSTEKAKQDKDGKFQIWISIHSDKWFEIRKKYCA